MDNIKIKAPNELVFDEMVKLLNGVLVKVKNRKRLYVATGRLPDGLEKRLRSIGAFIVEDRRYDPESE